jgi:multisubunit Na+/H+ antiporter MnhG subunit
VLGLLQILSAFAITLIVVMFWYYYLILRRTARALAADLGVIRAENNFRRPVITTVCTSVIIIGLLVSGSLHVSKHHVPYFPTYLVSYFPVGTVFFFC